MKKVRLTKHALQQSLERGASIDEIEISISLGSSEPVKKGRSMYRYNFDYNALWQGKHYLIKQVCPIVAEENDEFVVITVFTYYF